MEFRGTRYSYEVHIPTGASKTVTGPGDSNCKVDILPATFQFELVGDNLIATDQSKKLTFTPQGTVKGLFGTWSFSKDGFTLDWKFGNGKIVATGYCPGNLTATVEADADFKNFFTIDNKASNEVTESGLTCNASIDAATMQYFFDGATLVLSSGGAETRLSP